MSNSTRIDASGQSPKTVGNGKGNPKSFAPRPARTPGPDLVAPLQSLVDAAGGINSITYDEVHRAPNSAFKNLTPAQKRGVHKAMERLEEWSDSSAAMTRSYEVTQWPGKPTVVYGRLRNSQGRSQATSTRLELDDEGSVLTQHVGYDDEYGTVWYNEVDDADEDSDESGRWAKAR